MLADPMRDGGRTRARRFGLALTIMGNACITS